MGFRSILFADTVPTQTGAQLRLYNVPLLERHIRLLVSLGAKEVVLVGPDGADGDRLREVLGRVDQAWIAPVVPPAFYSVTERPDKWLTASSGPVLLMDAHHLVDTRLLEALLKAGPDTMTVDPEAPTALHLALVSNDTIQRLAASWSDSSGLWDELGSRNAGQLRRLNLRKINPYIVNLRRTLPVYWLPVSSEADAQTGEALLIDAAQKGTLDWPARYLHPPFENRLTRLVSRTRISPNDVTTVTNLVAFVVTCLLASGYLVTGLFLAAIVGVLDGVDGKLARVTVRCTKFGDRYEHILDNVYELSWYWALAWTLNGAGAQPLALIAGAVITLFYLLDRAATGLYKYRSGIELFDVAPIDRLFRSIGGRRNIYVLSLLAGAALNVPLIAFTAAAGWAVVTAVFHWSRAVWLLMHRSKADQAALYSSEAAS